MVKKRLRNLVNVALLSGGGGMFVRVAVVCVCGMGAWILGARWAAAEDLTPDQASAFVVGKLFSYTCFEGTAGMGRISTDGSVIGTIRIRGQGEMRFAALPPGTIRVDGGAVCAHLSGLPITPCFRVQKIDTRSFRGSVAGLDFAYCDFYQRNQRTHFLSNPNSPPTTPIAMPLHSMRLSFHE
jgi:hypothetical protein